MSSADFSVNWSGYRTWTLVLPPNRPGEDLLATIYALVCGAGEDKAVCILGSTPEFRTVCSRLPCEVDVIDKSALFFDFASSLCVKSRRERFINNDWTRALSCSGRKYDFILSHLTHGNIPYSERRQFFQAVSGALSPSGRFVDYVFQPRRPGYTPGAIVQLFRDRPLNLRCVNDFNSVAVFQNHLIGELCCVDTTLIYADLETQIADRQTRLIIQHTKELTPPGNRWDYSFDVTPDSLGYSECFQRLCRIDEPAASPFYQCAYLVISEKANG